jgi:hypothetical protein
VASQWMDRSEAPSEVMHGPRTHSYLSAPSKLYHKEATTLVVVLGIQSSGRKDTNKQGTIAPECVRGACEGQCPPSDHLDETGAWEGL